MSEVEYLKIDRIQGPLVFVDDVEGIKFGEIVDVKMPSGEVRKGKVLLLQKNKAMIEVFQGTRALDKNLKVRFVGETAKLNVSYNMIGRVFSGLGEPRDGGTPIIPEKKMDIVGNVINPIKRDVPRVFIETGISAIDGTCSLIEGQKLPIFSGVGLPHYQMAAQIVRQAKIPDSDKDFAVVLATMGVSNDVAEFMMDELRNTGAISRSVVFMNLADDPVIERLMTPKLACTAAEYLAFEHDMAVMVVLIDMTNYCNALREVSAEREEIPGREGYPGYMYTDLASIYERCGVIKGSNGSITMMPILTMPNNDITHPIPDLTGYITEGQIVTSTDLFKKNVYPPVDILSSLSRMMHLGVGKDKTREDHMQVSDQIYAAYAKGKDLEAQALIIGAEVLSEVDRQYIEFAHGFEKEFLNQGGREDRSIKETLDIGWRILSILPEIELSRISKEYLQKYKGAALSEENQIIGGAPSTK